MSAKSPIVILTIALNLSLPSAVASAGYYPTKTGEQLQIQGCISAKAKSPFVIYLAGDDDKKIEIKRFNSLPQLRSGCAKGEVEIKAKWKVDRKGDYALYGRDLNSKRSYFLWPDGIESR
jgi:hypothetical protein